MVVAGRRSERAPATAVPVVLVRAETWYCALPIEFVSETFRPLLVRPLDGVPPYVRGIAVIRGESAPVLNLAALISGGEARPGRRFVALYIDGRPAAVEVDEVLGVRHLSEDRLDESKPLVSGEALDRVRAMAVLDDALVAWVEVTRLLPPEVLDLLLAEGWG